MIKVVSNEEILHNIQSFVYENFDYFHLNIEIQRNDYNYNDNHEN
jgi:hypothetical protein